MGGSGGLCHVEMATGSGCQKEGGDTEGPGLLRATARAERAERRNREREQERMTGLMTASCKMGVQHTLTNCRWLTAPVERESPAHHMLRETGLEMVRGGRRGRGGDESTPMRSGIGEGGGGGEVGGKTEKAGDVDSKEEAEVSVFSQPPSDVKPYPPTPQLTPVVGNKAQRQGGSGRG